MSESVLVGLLSLLGTCLGTLGGFRITTYRIEQLEKKVEKHNHFADKIPVIEEKIKVINHRLEDIENE